MDTIAIIEKMLSGEMPMNEFIQIYKTDPSLKAAITELIPEEAKKDPTHSFWTHKTEHQIYSRYQHDLCKCIEDPYSRYLNGTFGSNLNMHGLISIFYLRTHPNVYVTDKYEKIFDLYIRVAVERFDGDDEVNKLLEDIILSAFEASNKKSEQNRIAKEAIYKAFHVDDPKHCPRWIQGGDWPMGKNSPMQYVRRENHGEAVHFIFRDFDTGEEKTVVEWY